MIHDTTDTDRTRQRMQLSEAVAAIRQAQRLRHELDMLYHNTARLLTGEQDDDGVLELIWNECIPPDQLNDYVESFVRDYTEGADDAKVA